MSLPNRKQTRIAPQGQPKDFRSRIKSRGQSSKGEFHRHGGDERPFYSRRESNQHAPSKNHHNQNRIRTQYNHQKNYTFYDNMGTSQHNNTGAQDFSKHYNRNTIHNKNERTGQKHHNQQSFLTQNTKAQPFKEKIGMFHAKAAPSQEKITQSKSKEATQKFNTSTKPNGVVKGFNNYLSNDKKNSEFLTNHEPTSKILDRTPKSESLFSPVSHSALEAKNEKLTPRDHNDEEKTIQTEIKPVQGQQLEGKKKFDSAKTGCENQNLLDKSAVGQGIQALIAVENTMDNGFSRSNGINFKEDQMHLNSPLANLEAFAQTQNGISLAKEKLMEIEEPIHNSADSTSAFSPSFGSNSTSSRGLENDIVVKRVKLDLDTYALAQQSSQLDVCKSEVRQKDHLLQGKVTQEALMKAYEELQSVLIKIEESMPKAIVQAINSTQAIMNNRQRSNSSRFKTLTEFFGKHDDL